MRIAMGVKDARRLFERIIGRLLIGVLVLLFSLLVSSAAQADDLIDVHISGDPPIPEVINTELCDIFSDTLTHVLFGGDGSIDLAGLDPIEIAEGIRTGINIVIEPRGYTVAQLHLDTEAAPAVAEFLVHPSGWTEENRASVESVEVELGREGLDEFWIERMGERLAAREDDLREVYEEYLVGLPANAADESWVLGIVIPCLEEADPLPELFPGFAVTRSVTLGSTATVTILLAPVEELIELVRPRMYSFTLYNVILDRLRERLLAEADFIEGMPRAEIDAAKDEIAHRLEDALERDPLMDHLDAYASITILTLADEPVVRIDTMVESLAYDLWLEAFVDFGNESRDSAEIQSRFGVLLARGIEIFVNLNYFTNDSTLETDIALGLRPTRGTFAAIGYDTEREAGKYFFEQQVSPGLIFRGEIFEDDAFNEFGVTYQFQQYLSAGMYTNGDNEYWVRAIFAL